MIGNHLILARENNVLFSQTLFGYGVGCISSGLVVDMEVYLEDTGIETKLASSC
ncbi:hypothetical protein L873DRAFT_1824283 [Choiromyces venosus 120613-1]|uniref:Uncharacterized protein n=1 Tax=Choiromyces venosus 120613-1 TaxID=1336337 RepID=A0A3N4IS69_9PEZI|nr:hypothetical protein L873DRAFT_1824283 [Choiromyces venosus 120613-1]